MFGEERHLMIHQAKLANQAERNKLRKQGKIPTEFENLNQEDYSKMIKAPISIECTSTTGELFKISSAEFFKKLLNNKITERELLINLNLKRQIMFKKQ